MGILSTCGHGLVNALHAVQRAVFGLVCLAFRRADTLVTGPKCSYFAFLLPISGTNPTLPQVPLMGSARLCVSFFVLLSASSRKSFIVFYLA